MLLRYIACIPFDHATMTPHLVARSCWPMDFCYQNSVLTYNIDLYQALKEGCFDGVCGKWATPQLFIPPLALFLRYEDAAAALLIHNKRFGAAP